MANLTPGTPVEVRVGDSGFRISFLLTDASRKTVRDLTGYAAWVTFWYPGATEPHSTRGAAVGTTDGLITYTFVGDELPTVGECICQATISTPDWYLGNAAGRGHHRVSIDKVKFIVKAAPA